MTAAAPTYEEVRPGRLPGIVVACWLVAFAAVEWLRVKTASSDGTPLDTLGSISVLEALEWGLILRAVPWREGERVSRAAGFAVLGAMAVAVLAAGQKPVVAAALLAMIGVGLSRLLPPIRVTLVALALFVSQYVLTGWPFLAVHNAIGRLDAAVTRAGLHAQGQAVSGSGSLVALPQGARAYDVMWGCATSTTLVAVLPAYLLIVLCLRKRFAPQDALWVTGLSALIFPLNWIRLQLICGQPGGYDFWHEGQGAAIFGALFGALVLAAAWVASRERRTAR